MKFQYVEMIAKVSLYLITRVAVENIQQHLVIALENSPASWKRKNVSRDISN